MICQSPSAFFQTAPAFIFLPFKRRFFFNTGLVRFVLFSFSVAVELLVRVIGYSIRFLWERLFDGFHNCFFLENGFRWLHINQRDTWKQKPALINYIKAITVGF